MQSERVWLPGADLTLTGCIILFFVVSPAFGYPLTYDESYQVMQIVFPVFVGYLATAVAFVVRPVAEQQIDQQRLSVLRLLIRGPIFLFAGGILIVWLVFGYSNSGYALAGTGMTLKVFTNLHTALLAILAATTGGLIAFLFPSKDV
jgi:hypothetical protein